MEVTLTSPTVTVLDDLLDPTRLGELAAWARAEHYVSPHEEGWLRVFRLGDGAPLNSKAWTSLSRCEASIPRRFLETIAEAARTHGGLLGPWRDLSLRSYLYPRGTRLGWHVDLEGRACGAYVFYFHPRWSARWGGELFVATHSAGDAFYEPRSESSLEPAALDEDLSAPGVFTAIQPRPNRLVLLAPQTAHMIARVDDAAGDAVRCSLTGFFYPEPVDPRERPESLRDRARVLRRRLGV